MDGLTDFPDQLDSGEHYSVYGPGPGICLEIHKSPPSSRVCDCFSSSHDLCQPKSSFPTFPPAFPDTVIFRLLPSCLSTPPLHSAPEYFSPPSPRSPWFSYQTVPLSSCADSDFSTVHGRLVGPRKNRGPIFTVKQQLPLKLENARYRRDFNILRCFEILLAQSVFTGVSRLHKLIFRVKYEFTILKVFTILQNDTRCMQISGMCANFR